MSPRTAGRLPPGYYIQPSIFYKCPFLYDLLSPCLKLHRLWQAECERLDPRPGDVILDACSGTGALASRMARMLGAGGSVIGADLTGQMTRRAKGKAKGCPLYVVRGSVEALPFADESFDKTSVSLALHEMPREARGRALSEAARVTKRGGRVVVGEFWPSGEWYVRLFERLFEEPRWIAEMEGLGREIEDSHLRVMTQELLPGAHFQVVVARKGG
ncbi:MAG: class I SAM-dependent methyltransferase [Chloroflexi bacterium]|nr:class I SAM-dependent methyltransferase [Chloroflexota bacterium]